MRKINPARLLQKKALPGQGKAIKHSFSAMCCSLPGLSGPRLKDTHSVVGVSLPRSAALVKGKSDIFCILLKIILSRLYAAAFTR